jgi:Zn-dependent peptidase ImmA (M78 family)
VSESLTLHGYMKIKATFGISIQATITRGRRLILISRERQRSLVIQISTRGWRKNEPVSVGKESPVLLWTELTAAHGPNPYFIASKEYDIAPRLLEQWVPAKNASPHGGRATLCGW